MIPVRTKKHKSVETKSYVRRLRNKLKQETKRTPVLGVTPAPKSQTLIQTLISKFVRKPTAYQETELPEPHYSPPPVVAATAAPVAATNACQGCGREDMNQALTCTGQGRDRRQIMKILTHNVQSIQAAAVEIATLIHDHSPDIMVLTELRLKRKHKRAKWLTNAMQGYQYWVSTHTENAQATRGVLVAVKEHLAVLGRARATEGDTCHGRLMHVVLHLPHSVPIEIAGIYAPAGNTKEDENQRKVLNTRLTTLMGGPAHEGV
jgi:hypothetical protein